MTACRLLPFSRLSKATLEIREFLRRQFRLCPGSRPTGLLRLWATEVLAQRQCLSLAAGVGIELDESNRRPCVMEDQSTFLADDWLAATSWASDSRQGHRLVQVNDQAALSARKQGRCRPAGTCELDLAKAAVIQKTMCIPSRTLRRS